jgi:hypothetical protein
MPAAHTLGKGSPLFENTLCFLRCLPEAVLGNNGLNIVEPLFFVFYVKDNPSAVPAHSEEI